MNDQWQPSRKGCTYSQSLMPIQPPNQEQRKGHICQNGSNAQNPVMGASLFSASQIQTNQYCPGSASAPQFITSRNVSLTQ